MMNRMFLLRIATQWPRILAIVSPLETKPKRKSNCDANRVGGRLGPAPRVLPIVATHDASKFPKVSRQNHTTFAYSKYVKNVIYKANAADVRVQIYVMIAFARMSENCIHFSDKANDRAQTMQLHYLGHYVQKSEVFEHNGKCMSH